MNQEQLSREIADFEFWQQTQNECDRGYVRSGNSVMRRALKEYEEQQNDTTQ
jgi:hypothetical protein